MSRCRNAWLRVRATIGVYLAIWTTWPSWFTRLFVGAFPLPPEHGIGTERPYFSTTPGHIAMDDGFNLITALLLAFVVARWFADTLPSVTTSDPLILVAHDSQSHARLSTKRPAQTH